MTGKPSKTTCQLSSGMGCKLYPGMGCKLYPGMGCKLCPEWGVNFVPEYATALPENRSLAFRQLQKTGFPGKFLMNQKHTAKQYNWMMEQHKQ